VMISDKESGVGVQGAAAKSVPQNDDRSVRKSQQPPSLERQVIMLRR
jgi:hypothetical protein